MTTLLIFIDGLSFDRAAELPILAEYETVPIRPGIGFSNNLYPEMLAGTNPDQIGYFNEWSPLETAKQPLPWFVRILDFFRPSLYLNAGLRKIILRKIFRKDYSNIPFKYAHIFKPQGSHDFRAMKDGHLVDFNFDIFDAVEMSGKVGERDWKAIDSAMSGMQNKNTLLSLVDVDNLSHIVGLKSPVLAEHIEKLNSKLVAVVEKFESLADSPQVFLFSDHGMVDIKQFVSIEIEKALGPMRAPHFLYFVDATYLRIWSDEAETIRNAKKFLEGCDYGELLSEAERKAGGVSNPDFGNLLFRANEGVMFLPNFYGARKIKSMHGYDGSARSQWAFFSGPKSISQDGISNPKISSDIYTYLGNYLENRP